MSITTLSEKIEEAIENDSAATQLDEIASHRCASDNFSGVEYDFFGAFVPIRPIIDVVAKEDGYAIEEMAYVNDCKSPKLIVFVAELPEPPTQPHPAFVKP